VDRRGIDGWKSSHKLEENFGSCMERGLLMYTGRIVAENFEL